MYIPRVLKDTLKCLQYTVQYRTFNTPFGCRLERTSFPDGFPQLGIKSVIFDSSLGSNVGVSNFSSILDSKISSNVRIEENCRICDSTIGRFSYIASNSICSNSKLGSFCSFGPYSLVGCGDHPTHLPSTNPVFYSTQKQCGYSFSKHDFFKEKKESIVGNDVWIGAQVFIKDGISIGNGAIIGAGAVVINDIPDYAIVGGVPAKIIRFRYSSDVIQKLLKTQWWNWSEEKLRAAQPYFIKPDISSFLRWSLSA